MGSKVFEQQRNNFLKQIIAITYPDFARKLGIKTIREDVTEFFMKIVKDVVEYREKNNIKRNDFMDLLLKMKENGTLQDEANHSGMMTIEEIAAQAFVFFLAVCIYRLFFITKESTLLIKIESHIFVTQNFKFISIFIEMTIE